MKARRLYGPTVVTVLLSGLIAFFAASRSWESSTLRTEGLPSDVVTVTGTDALPIVGALSLVVAAGGLAVLATRGMVRRVVGGLIVLAAGGAAVSVAAGGGARGRAFRDAVTESPAFVGSTPLHGTLSPWIAVAFVALVLGAVGGVLTVLRGHTWPAMSGRYDAPAAKKESSRRFTGRPEDAAGSELWAEIDEGRDPTE